MKILITCLLPYWPVITFILPKCFSFHVLPWHRPISILPSTSSSYYPARSLFNHGPVQSYNGRSSKSKLCMARDANPNIIFQKVLRAPPKNQFFLPTLVDYIQTQFEIPKDLPMVYSATIPNDGDDDDHDVDGTYSILELNSPLSRNPDATRMEVEIVGIYTEKDESKGSGLPSMAMVVVKKMNVADANNAVMMKRLFDDSEAKILKALERALDDLMEGKVKVPREGFVPLSSSSTLSSGKEEEMDVGWSGLESLGDFEGFEESDGTLEDLLLASSGKDLRDDAIDVVVKESSPSKSELESESESDIEVSNAKTSTKKDIPLGNTKKSVKTSKDTVVQQGPDATTVVATTTTIATTGSTTTKSSTVSSGGGDFAVVAAKAAAAAKKAKKMATSGDGDFAVEAAKAKMARSGGGDFAVEAAKAAAKNLKKVPKPKKKVVDEDDEPVMETNASSANPKVMESQGVTMGSSMPMELSKNGPSPMLENLSKRGASGYQVKISNANKYKKRSKIFEEAIAEKSQRLAKEKKDREINVVVDKSVKVDDLAEEERQKKLDEVPFTSISKSGKVPPSSSSNGSRKVTKTDKEIEQDVLKAALDIMPGSLEEDNANEDMTAEELLKSILKFGEEKDNEEADGTGFVKGAFSKARELTANNPKSKTVGFKEVSKSSNLMEDIKYEDDVDKPKEKLTPEEELKRIFAAGESIAESRITTSNPSKKNMLSQETKVSKNSIVDDQYVDDLIESDKTIPRNARTLDDELVELEVRISKTPGEDSEAYGPNPVFDIFSGPEVYNPNVDPLTTVNWPGAIPGTRNDIRLPPELNEAVRSANYAAKLLSRMIEENNGDESKVFYIDGKKVSDEQIKRLQRAVEEGVAVGLIEDPMKYMQEKSRLQILVNELVNQPEDRFGDIATFYKDILLSDNFVILLKENLKAMAQEHLEAQRSGIDSTELEERHRKEREVLGKLVKYAQLLLKEAQALGAELETAQLEIIRSICNVAMDPSHTTEEETSLALKDAVRDMKPLLDENFVAYLKYAIAEEEARLARAGLLDDPEHNRWLFVLKIVQEGVYSELAVGIQRYIDHIGYVLRMETKQERKQLLSKLIDVMPSMDVRPFVKVVDNIAASLGQGRKGEFDTAVLGSMTNKILQLRRDVHDLLPPERIKDMSKVADEWAARQRKKLMERRGVAQQRLKAARESTFLEDEIGRRGEVERFT